LDATRAKDGSTVRQENPVVVSLLKAKAKDRTPLVGPPKPSVTQRLKLKKDQQESLGLRRKRRASNGTI
jgi:hypothetical protein